MSDNDNAAGAGAIGFIYYSGHGAAEKDTNINYRIPVDAKELGSTASWDESVKLDEVTIAKSFAVGRFAVTRGEFAAFVAATGHKTNGVAMRALNGSKMLNAIGARLASHRAINILWCASIGMMPRLIVRGSCLPRV